MRVEYSRRAVSDIRQIVAYHNRSGNRAVAERIAARIQAVVAGIGASPLSGQQVVQRPGVRVALLVSYRYKIFDRGGRRRDPDHTHPPHLSAAICLTVASYIRDIGCIWHVAGTRIRASSASTRHHLD